MNQMGTILSLPLICDRDCVGLICCRRKTSCPPNADEQMWSAGESGTTSPYEQIIDL
jgi:hypothetical protein